MPNPTTLLAKMAAISREIGPIEKTAKNPHLKSKYAPYEAVMANLQPLLDKYKVAVQFTSRTPDRDGYIPIILWVCDLDADPKASDHFKSEYHMPLERQTGMGVGSATSYARRYLLQMAFNIVVVGEDDDGAKAEKAAKRQRKASDPDDGDDDLFA